MCYEFAMLLKNGTDFINRHTGYIPCGATGWGITSMQGKKKTFLA